MRVVEARRRCPNALMLMLYRLFAKQHLRIAMSAANRETRALLPTTFLESTREPHPAVLHWRLLV